MAYSYKNQPTVFQFNVPSSQSNKLSDIRYTLFKIDYSQTNNDITIVIPETNDNITETQNGAYQTELNLDIGTYSLSWKILNTPYVGNEDINVISNINDKLDSLVNEGSNYTAYGD